MALLRSGGWRVRITDIGADAALEPVENEGLLGAALRDGRAVYVCADVCKLGQLTEGTVILSFRRLIFLHKHFLTDLHIEVTHRTINRHNFLVEGFYDTSYYTLSV
jgi:hypothetical protein